MKFHATIVFEFNAHEVAEAGERLNALLEQRATRASSMRSARLHEAFGAR
jgi:hypothetical protein